MRELGCKIKDKNLKPKKILNCEQTKSILKKVVAFSRTRHQILSFNVQFLNRKRKTNLKL